jgi:hypothetical protein
LPTLEPRPGPPPAHNSTPTQFTFEGTVHVVVHADPLHDHEVMVWPVIIVDPSNTSPRSVLLPPPPLGYCGPHVDPLHVKTCPDAGVDEEIALPWRPLTVAAESVPERSPPAAGSCAAVAVPLNCENE